jgi:hypothetical protein
MPIDIKYDANINKNYIYLNGEPDPNDLKLIKSKSYARVKTNDEADAKTSDRKTQKLGNKTDNDKNLLVIYKFILSQIKYAILFATLAKILFLQFVYFILIKFEQIKLHVQNHYQNENIECNELKQKKRVDSSASLAAPSNVCVILNERIKSNDTVYDTFSRIAEFLAANGARNLTFYSFDGAFRLFFKFKLF